MGFRVGLAEEVGVEPTSHLNSSSTALKAARPTGSDALPSAMISKLEWLRHHRVIVTLDEGLGLCRETQLGAKLKKGFNMLLMPVSWIGAERTDRQMHSSF